MVASPRNGNLGSLHCLEAPPLSAVWRLFFNFLLFPFLSLFHTHPLIGKTPFNVNGVDF
ncbi:hypothetical protein PDIG_71340 [Penicillium digitatum PHI26]|uniref:Uncharacterized protein n=2 Tax=Penicillium digitatum TaxID=36651 RepID=K9FEQ8_PEND2|nr:hypothetical protein PDIP_80640 [Penicillium digitatum Pd1]EKV06062.1 hypothetical protein PDIP_80640 [Penicillium digitatum Pd1]EKV07704.1 hypothetical protein PDIG_71340 [Penicillium digitatum PHI26]